jgi:hypothetical protein
VQGLLTAAQRRIEQGERPCKTADGPENEVCFDCPLENDCSATIKAKYLKRDVCLWRTMTAVIDDCPSSLRDGSPLYRSEVQGHRPVLEVIVG